MEKRIAVLDKGYVELIDMMGSDARIVEVARISYAKEGDTVEKQQINILTKLLNNEHGSPFEQVVFTFKVKCPIFVARQWQRHRTFSYNEQSRRYTKDNWEYYLPTLDRLPKDKVSSEYIQMRIRNNMELEIREYNDMIAYGVAPEIARTMMGVGFYTTFYCTVNLRNLFHFISLRTDTHAQKEMQEYASALELLVEQSLPLTYAIKREESK